MLVLTTWSYLFLLLWHFGRFLSMETTSFNFLSLCHPLVSPCIRATLMEGADCCRRPHRVHSGPLNSAYFCAHFCALYKALKSQIINQWSQLVWGEYTGFLVEFCLGQTCPERQTACLSRLQGKACVRPLVFIFVDIGQNRRKISRAVKHWCHTLSETRCKSLGRAKGLIVYLLSWWHRAAVKPLCNRSARFSRRHHPSSSSSSSSMWLKQTRRPPSSHLLWSHGNLWGMLGLMVIFGLSADEPCRPRTGNALWRCWWQTDATLWGDGV